MGDVNTVIVLVLILLALGIVIDQLFRLRRWLNEPPRSPELREPPDDKS